MTKVLELVDVCKSFKQGSTEIAILDGATFTLHTNEIVAVVGPSGCGKTTLLQAIGLLDPIDSGHIMINGENFAKVSDSKKTRYRKLSMGFIYQAYNLLSDFSAIENVMLPLRLQGVSKRKARLKAVELLQSLGLGNRINHLPGQLSGGEQQRVAIARSIIHEPSVILADEPTGNLDHHNALNVIDILIGMVRSMQKSMVIVTHNLEIALKADRAVTIEDGKIVEYTLGE
jgi:lipoprotein-releasing system ATP-binding protein